MQMVLKLGGQIGAGMEVDGLVLSKEASPETGKRVAKGVKLKDGTVLEADLVIICTGAWTPSLFPSPSLGISHLLQASGQSVAKIQLTKDEAERQSKFPVIFDLSTGFYTFPPNPEGIVKVAIHGLGYINPDANGISTPRTVLTPGAEDGFVPKEMAADLRAGLKTMFPELAKKDFFGCVSCRALLASKTLVRRVSNTLSSLACCRTRLCWYTDSPSGEWLIDYQPDIEGLLFATGGCGHAFKVCTLFSSPGPGSCASSYRPVLLMPIARLPVSSHDRPIRSLAPSRHPARAPGFNVGVWRGPSCCDGGGPPPGGRSDEEGARRGRARDQHRLEGLNLRSGGFLGVSCA